MIRRALEWIEDRTGLESAVKGFLYEQIPGSSGWHQVLGSVALFLFLTQAFTGILLAFNYAPTPGESYNSVRYIVTEVTGGRLIRNLHHWGASMLIVVVVLHMVQVFLFGAYKKPREATWMMGVVLLLMTLGYGLTGYLLPWDNRAYWGTVVATQIGASVPLAGPYVQRLLGSDGPIGVVTFARFYALHVLLLPPATALLIFAHVYLVRRHGVAPMPVETAPKKPFFPGQVLKDTLAIFAAFSLLFVMAATLDAPLGRLADPTDATYIPRPDWYFLFLFQTLKFFEGRLEFVGSVVLPTLAIAALFLTPFLDRGAPATPLRRWKAIGLVCLAAAGWSGLTAAAILTTPESPPESAFEEGPQDWQRLSPEELAGMGYFRKEDCASCHNLGEGRAKIGPDLARSARKRSAGWMIEHFRNPQGNLPGSQMPPVQLTKAQMNALAAFLQKLTPANAKALQQAPQAAVEGAMVYQAQSCFACHRANGVGVRMGPDLNGLARRRTRDWIEGHFREPQKYSPGTVMPAYNLPPRDLDRLTAYLLELPAQ